MSGDDHIVAPGAPPVGRAAPWARRWAPLAVIAVLVVLLGLAGGGGPGTPLDPAGTGPSGARALVLLLGRYGSDVRLVSAVPGPGDGVAVVLRDVTDSSRRGDILAWVRRGGRLVVADPTSPLQTAVPEQVAGLGDHHPQGDCPALGLGPVHQLSVGPSLGLRATDTRSTACFSLGGDAAFLVAAPVGAGTVVGLAGAGVWTNQRLAEADNAALAVGLLAPGTAPVDIIVAAPVGSGHRSATGLLGTRVRQALVQLLLAFVLLALGQGRRLGRPVPEETAVQVPGAELVTAVGSLMARSGNREAAARALRRGARRELGEGLGLGPAPSTEALGAALAVRGVRLDPTVLADPPAAAGVGDDAELVRLAAALADLRQEVLHGPRA